MTVSDALAHFQRQLAGLREAALFKQERTILGRQSGQVRLAGVERPVLNLCSNNYLGLAGDARVTDMAREALERHGYGLSSVRFICGRQEVHEALERRLSDFLGTDDTILYSSCFDANTGLFETLFDESDAIISDELNHASIIDGIRLSKARRLRYKNTDMADLERQLQAASDARFRVIATDGVFSMDGIVADLPRICALAERYGALTMVDDSHAVGFFGASGKGTPEHFGLQGRIDLLTGTLGKALGGASGGYVSGRGPLIGWLRQRSRPYLFSNSLAPVIAATSLGILDLIAAEPALRTRLWANAAHFRARLEAMGFTLAGGGAPIIPVMLGEAAVAAAMAEALLGLGVYVTAFSYPVVPEGKARIRTQVSAAHSLADLDTAAEAFREAGRAVGALPA